MQEAQGEKERVKKMDLTSATASELVEELEKRAGIYSRKIVPCEHYRITLRGEMIVNQSVGSKNTHIIVVDL